MMVVLSVPLNPNPMHLPLPLAILYLTHPAVTKVTSSLKYKHAPTRWQFVGTQNSTSQSTRERYGWILLAINVKGSIGGGRRMRNPVWPSSCVTPAGASTSLTSRINGMATGGCSEGLGAFWFFFKDTHTHIHTPLHGRINASGAEWLGWQGRIARLCAIE